jgi:hypothetical protein
MSNNAAPVSNNAVDKTKHAASHPGGAAINAIKRPFAVSVISCLFIAAGAVGFVYHFPQLLAHRSDSVWIELVRLLAIVAGVFMFLGRNWARWLALAWMAFHVVISFPVAGQLAMHALLLALIAYGLFRADAASYFLSRRLRTPSQP